MTALTLTVCLGKRRSTYHFSVVLKIVNAYVPWSKISEEAFSSSPLPYERFPPEIKGRGCTPHGKSLLCAVSKQGHRGAYPADVGVDELHGHDGRGTISDGDHHRYGGTHLRLHGDVVTTYLTGVNV